MKDITSPRAGERNEYSAIFLMTNAARRLSRFALWVALTMVSVGILPPVLAEDGGASPAADISAIMKKAQSGQPLTNEDRRALQAWGKSFSQQLKTPAGRAPSISGPDGQNASSSGRAEQRDERRSQTRWVPLSSLHGTIVMKWNAQGSHSKREINKETTWHYDAGLTIMINLTGSLGTVMEYGKIYAQGTVNTVFKEKSTEIVVKYSKNGVEKHEHTLITEATDPTTPLGKPGNPSGSSTCTAELYPRENLVEFSCEVYTHTSGTKETSLPGRLMRFIIYPRDPKSNAGHYFLTSPARKEGDEIAFAGNYTTPTKGPWVIVEVLAERDAYSAVMPVPAYDLIKWKDGLQPWPGTLQVDWDVRAKAVIADPLPCPPNPCLDYSGLPRGGPRLNAEQCQQLASWVAVGTIEDVVRNPATFTFRVIRWEKPPSGHRPDTIPFEVKRCQQELPATLAPQYRFYGRNAPEPHDLEKPDYLYFEPIEASGAK